MTQKHIRVIKHGLFCTPKHFINLTHNFDFSSLELEYIPNVLLSILPKRKYKSQISNENYNIASKYVIYANSCLLTGHKQQCILLDFACWISAIQRTQLYGLNLNEPFRYVICIFI